MGGEVIKKKLEFRRHNMCTFVIKTKIHHRNDGALRASLETENISDMYGFRKTKRHRATN